jgi:hypothetical protein
MTRQQILGEIQRIAAENGSKAPGSQRFESETGISTYSWNAYWLRWGDALLEAGFEPNPFSEAHSADFIITKYIEVIREIGKFPIQGELDRKRKTDKSFPSLSSLRHFGSKEKRASEILTFCRKHEEFADVIPYCEAVLADTPRGTMAPESASGALVGYVYLVKHGSRREYKIGKTINPLRREGEIALQLPEKLEPIHTIKTDDPSGVERYWHSRFASKRKEGEWFALTPEDVRAFKRWRSIY